MKISCSNFGPIHQGSLNLSKDLIIICGANNSGKTYFSYFMYGLLKATQNFKIDKTFVDVKSFELFPHTTLHGNIDIRIVVDLVELYRAKKEEILNSLSQYAKECLAIVFPNGTDLSNSAFAFTELPDRDILKSIFWSQFDKHGMFKPLSGDPERTSSYGSTKYQKSNDIHIRIVVKQSDRNLTHLTEDDLEVVHNIVLKQLLLFAFDIEKNDIKIFLAERIAIDIFSRDLAGARKAIALEIQSTQIKAQSKDNAYSQAFYGELFKYLPDEYYNLPLKDAIVSSSVIMMYSRDEGPLAHLGKLIEDQILGGSLLFGDRDSGYEIKFQSKNGDPVKIELASSLVKSLSSIVLYLKHQAAPHDIILIDEPELCLHPTIQRKLAVILARVVKSKIKVIISTHSDFLIREFNNLIMLYQQSEEALALRKKYLSIGYDSNATLDFNNVGVNLFIDRKIIEIECTETGFAIPLIDEAIQTQNEISQEIYFSLF